MLLAAALIVGDMLIADYATKGAVGPIAGAVFGIIADFFRFLPGEMPFQGIRRKEGRFPA